MIDVRTCQAVVGVKMIAGEIPKDELEYLHWVRGHYTFLLLRLGFEVYAVYYRNSDDEFGWGWKLDPVILLPVGHACTQWDYDTLYVGTFRYEDRERVRLSDFRTWVEPASN